MALKLITTRESGENSRRYINKLAPSGLSLGTSETDTHRLIFPLNVRRKIHSSYQKAPRLPHLKQQMLASPRAALKAILKYKQSAVVRARSTGRSPQHVLLHFRFPYKLFEHLIVCVLLPNTLGFPHPVEFHH